MSTPPTKRCGRCSQPRPAFKPQPEWGRTPDPLCPSCWSKYADARTNGTFVDFNDAFDNASDEQLAARLGFES